MNSMRYDERGVSASKTEVHEAIKHLDKGLYPNAFCKILPDLVAQDEAFCNIMHADTAGTKTSLAYIYWKETGDLSVWNGIVQDAIVMNVDDMACVGCIDNIVISSTVGRNKSRIPGDVLSTIINGTQQFLDQLQEYGVTITLSGGETADVGDIVRTVDVGITAFGRMPRKNVVKNDIQHGDVIVGLSSYGQASYEDTYNGGMGSNGLTSARHDIFEKTYARLYPESFDKGISDHLVYSGARKLTDTLYIDGFGPIPIGKLVLSPTRTYLPILKKLLETDSDSIHGMIHCTGGGQTKVMKFVQNKRVIKDNLLSIPPLFRLIEKESGTLRKEMYEVFNMGHRMEIYCSEDFAKTVINLASSFNVEAQVIGRVEESPQNELVIEDEKGRYVYH